MTHLALSRRAGERIFIGTSDDLSSHLSYVEVRGMDTRQKLVRLTINDKRVTLQDPDNPLGRNKVYIDSQGKPTEEQTDIQICLVDFGGYGVRLSIEAPRKVSIYRGEVLRKKQRELADR